MTPETNRSKNRLALIRRVNQLYHDFQAATFDRIHQARHKAEMAFWRHEVAARLVSKNFRQGIDLCSGTGFVASALLPRLESGTWVVCTDISTRALGRAQRSLKEFGNQLRTCVASAEYLPFPDESVDWVTINAGLHHIPQPKKALKEVDRILKRGGYFFLGFEPNARFPSSGAPYWLERFLWHVFWYLSPRRNFKRVARKLGRPGPHPNETEHLDAINQVLVQEGLIEKPLSLPDLRELVDVHSRQTDADHNETAFVTDELLNRFFPSYRIHYLRYTDYGGEMLKRHPWLRAAYDKVMAAMFPGKGRLFTWVLQKPAEREAPA